MFSFQQFEIDDRHCAMKVGTDAVLLGAWADVEDSQRILDVGCGSGVVTLMAAQRAPHAVVTGVELDEAAAADAAANAHRSPFAERVDIVCADILKLAAEAEPAIRLTRSRYTTTPARLIGCPCRPRLITRCICCSTSQMV